MEEFNQNKFSNRSFETIGTIKGILVSPAETYGGQHKIISEIKAQGEHLDFYQIQMTSFEGVRGFENVYSISPIDSRDKYSLSYRNCTGMVFSGIDKNTGEKISFITHQNPHEVSRRGATADKFIQDLSLTIEELIEKSKPNSVNGLGFGGNNPHGGGFEEMGFEDYINSVELIGEVCKKKLGFEIPMRTGPATTPNPKGNWDTDVFFRNGNGELYIVREKSKNPSLDEQYLPSQIWEQVEKWG